MAHFGNIDLHDYIINGLRLESDTGLGSEIYDQPTTRCRPGGLPFMGYVESFDEPPPRQDYHIDVANPQYSGFEDNTIVKSNNKKPKFGKVVYGPNDSLFGSSQLPPNFVFDEKYENKPPSTSDVECKVTNYQPFDDYARFNYCHDVNKGKVFNVLYTFLQDANGCPLKLKICVSNDASVAELIGLCMHVYSMEFNTPPANSVDDYSFYLAEDNKADTDFPKLSPYTKINKVLFENLALVLKSHMPNESLITVVIYFVTGHTYQIEVDSQDTPLYVIHKEAMRRKNLEAPDNYPRGFRFTNEYVVELLDKPGHTVDLNSTIATTGSREFIMLRKNSARAGFVPKRIPLSSEKRMSLIDEEHIDGASDVDIKKQSEFVFPSSSSHVVEEYPCDRLHKFRPKWPATITIRHDAFEVSPVSIERRKSVVSQPTQKLTYVDYDAVAGVWLGNDRVGGRRHVKICYIHVPTTKINEFFTKLREINVKEHDDLKSNRSNSVKNDRQSSVDSSASYDMTLRRNSMSLLLDGCSWKTLALDTKEADGWNIVTKLNNILDSRPSYIRRLYNESKNGTRNPLESACMYNKDILPSLSDSNGPTTPSGRSRKFNPIPRLTRMLSKQE